MKRKLNAAVLRKLGKRLIGSNVCEKGTNACGLQEFSTVIDDPDVAKAAVEKYFDPLWNWSYEDQ